MTWDTWEEYFASGYQGEIGIRVRTVGGKTRYNVTHAEALRTYEEMRSQGLSSANLHFSAMAPDDHIVWQGEIYYRNPEGLYGYITFEKCAMKKAFAKSGHHWQGLRLRELFRTTMTPSDQSDLEELLADYPDSVIELSVYSVLLGTCPHRRTLFWEVRNY